MWLFCSGSLIPNILAQDDAGEDAAYGTVGHSVGEEWLLRYDDELKAYVGNAESFDIDDLINESRPGYLIGKVVTVKHKSASFDITIDEEMLAFVRRYVVWCLELPGQHYVETRVNYEDLTPIPGQGGTADHAACSPGLLVISDLKMGKGVRVFAKYNTQALLYAYGFFREWDWLYDFQVIEIRICQPRLDHFDTWTITREELLAFAATVPARAEAAWVIGAPRTPGEKQCQWCKVKKDCAAHLAWMEDKFDESDTFEDETENNDIIEGTYTVKDMEGSQSRLLAGKPILPPKTPAELSTAAMAKLLPFRKQIEKFFVEMSAELLDRAQAGEEVPGWKLVMGRLGNREWVNTEEQFVTPEFEFIGLSEDEIYERTLKSPAAITDLLYKKYPGLSKEKAALLIAHLVDRKEGRETLVQDNDNRSASEDLSESFEDETVNEL